MARLRPSAAARWVPCPGSVVLCEQYPETEEESVPAAEGTAAHWVASEMLESYTNWDGNENRIALPMDFVNKPAPNGVIVTEEMVEAANSYVIDVLRTKQGLTGGAATYYVERYVHIHSVHPENEGTFDSAVFMHNTDSSVFILWDFKYGWGIVEPHGNWQLVNYAIGLLAEWQARGIPLPETVELRIVQPRPYHPLGPVRSWKATPTELFSFFEALHASAAEALGPNPRCTPGPHCHSTHCSARANCPALNKAVSWIQEFVENATGFDIEGDALGLSIEQLRAASKMVEGLLSGREERALAKIKGGEIVPGWDAQQGQGRTKWKSGKEPEILSLGDMMGVDLRKKDAQLITPKQAEKAGIDTSVISAYSETPTTGLKLVPAAATNQQAKKVFSNEQ